MSVPTNTVSEDSAAIPNGSGAAAILAAGIGSFAVALLAIASDKYALVKNLFVFYKPTGALSGEATVAIFFWLAAWAILDWRWRKRTVSLPRINVIALVLLGLSLLLTFPPIGDLL
jgi:membrane associated rhomboid family serine protease